MYVAMTKVSYEIGEARLWINSFAVPSHHSVDHECVPQIVDARPTPTGIRFQACVPNNAGDHEVHTPVGVWPLFVPEKSRGRFGGKPSLMAGLEVVAEDCGDTLGQRQLTRLEEFRLSNHDRFLAEINVADRQTGNFSDSQPDAIGQDYHGVDSDGAERRVRRWEVAGRL